MHSYKHFINAWLLLCSLMLLGAFDFFLVLGYYGQTFYEYFHTTNRVDIDFHFFGYLGVGLVGYMVGVCFIL